MYTFIWYQQQHRDIHEPRLLYKHTHTHTQAYTQAHTHAQTHALIYIILFTYHAYTHTHTIYDIWYTGGTQKALKEPKVEILKSQLYNDFIQEKYQGTDFWEFLAGPWTSLCCCWCVCVCVCIHVCIHVCMYIHMYSCMYVCLHVCVYVRVHIIYSI